MPLGLGLTKGASFVNDWEKDIDRLYQREEYAANVRYQKEQKTRFYAEQLKRGHASNPRVEAELNDFYKGLNNELANFVTENPNFETDVNAMQKFLDISDRYTNNTILQKDLQVKQEFDKLREARMKGDIDEDKYMEEMARYNEYIDPKNAGRTDDTYVFANFKTKEAADIFKELKDESAPNLGPTELDTKSHYLYNKEFVPYEQTEANVQAKYADPTNRRVMDKTYQSFVETAKKNGLDVTSAFPDAISYFAKTANNQYKKDRKYIGPDLEYSEATKFAYDKALKNQGTTNYYRETVVPAIRKLKNAKDEDGKIIPFNKVPADPASVALTIANDYKNEFMINADAGVMIADTNGVLKPLNMPITAKMSNVINHVNLGGDLYAEGTFSIFVPEDRGSTKDSKKAMYYTDDQLKQMGFTSGEIRDESIVDINTKTTVIKRGRRWSANGYFPEIHNDNTEFNYNKTVTGSGDKADKIRGAYGASAIDNPKVLSSKPNIYLSSGYGADIRDIAVDGDDKSFAMDMTDGKIYRKSELEDELRKRSK